MTAKVKIAHATFFKHLDQMSITIELSDDGSDLSVSGSTTSLQPKHIAWMKAHKEELINDLRERDGILSALRAIIDSSLVWMDLEDVIGRALDYWSTGCIPRTYVEEISISAQERAHQIPCSWENVRLSELAESHGRKLMINSQLLKETICLTGDADAPPKDAQGRIVYTAHELAHINGISADQLRSIHSVKKQFDGEIIATPPSDSPVNESKEIENAII